MALFFFFKKIPNIEYNLTDLLFVNVTFFYGFDDLWNYKFEVQNQRKKSVQLFIVHISITYIIFTFEIL